MNKINIDLDTFREQVKEVLAYKYVDDYESWVKTLVELNWFIKDEVSKSLITTSLDDGLLLTYNELCVSSIEAIDYVELDDLDINRISNDITDIIIENKTRSIIQYYLNLYKNKNYKWG